MFEKINGGLCEAEVLKNYPVGERFYRLSLGFEGAAADAFLSAKPGQFLEVRVDNLGVPENASARIGDKAARCPILRRPFSFVDIQPVSGGCAVDLLYCVVGPGTLRLTTLREGEKVSITGPLGNGFTLRKDKKYAIGIAGGIGIPPVEHFINHSAKESPALNNCVFLGSRSRADMPVESVQNGAKLAEYACCEFVGFASEDGSLGVKGYVTDAFLVWFEASGVAPQDCAIYACGPEPMLEAVARIAHKLGIECQVSLERMMACGIGLCQSCVVEVKEGETKQYKLCCKDGPVFDSRLVFDFETEAC
jgi:dihydroorotate dehydrogenase electron transfer subunit